MDHKGRVNVPVKFRKHIRTEEDDSLIITRGLDGCLFVYPIDEWEQIDTRLRELPVTRQNTRIFIRMLSSQAITASMDKQGRIALPRHLIELSRIDTEVMIVGTLDHFELWSPSEYEKVMAESGHTYESIAESLLA
tara:strand:- start:13235 stop:13642 length:408 start_codon:yes stop_codon:yes gene_type:complete